MQQHAGMSCKSISKIPCNSKETDKTIIIEKATAFKSASETEIGSKKLKQRSKRRVRKCFPWNFSFKIPRIYSWNFTHSLCHAH